MQTPRIPALVLALAVAPRVEGQEATLDFSGAYVADLLYNARGGLGRGGGLLHNLDLNLALDGGGAFGVEGVDGFLYLLANAGDSMVERAGDAQVSSNIEAPEAVRLYELWVRKRWAERWSLLVGLYDLNGEFYVTDAAGLFLNSSHGVGPELAASGITGPSIFPVTSLTARLEWTPAPGRFARIAVLDAVPGDPTDDSRFAHVALDDGALVVGEVGVSNEEARRKVALGAWAYTTDFPDSVDPGESIGRTYGVYAMGETLLGTVGGEGGSLVGFARIGIADPNVHSVASGWAAGIVHDRPLGLDGAQIGFGVASAVHSTRYLQAREDAATPVDRSEISFETTGSFEVAPWFRIQPDLQYIVNPGMDPTIDDALVLGARVEVSF